MLKVTHYKNNINNNYVLVHSTKQYISDYGEEDYKLMQQLFNTQCKLQKIIHCIANSSDDCYTTSLYVVQYKFKYYALYYNNYATNKTNIVQLNCKTLKQATHYALNTMQLFIQHI